MISLVQDAAKKIIDMVVKPGKWTLDDANGVQGSSTVNPPRVAYESTILKHHIKPRDAVSFSLNATFQYQINFRLDGRLKYDQLPIRKLTDMMSYLSFIFSTHPTLLEKTVSQLDTLDDWQFTHVDPCLFDTSESAYEVTDLTVNSFIPVIEQSNNDWVMVLVLSFDVTLDCLKSAYRKYFEDTLGTDLIPGLSGGKIGNIDKLTLTTNRKNPPIKEVGRRVIQ